MTVVPIPPDSDFPIENLPYGVFSTASNPVRRVGVAIGNHVLDLRALEDAGLLRVTPAALFGGPTIGPLLEAGRRLWTATRTRLQTLLRGDDPALRDDAALRQRAIVPIEQCTLHLPVDPPGYTDFYSSKEHASAVGAMFRGPENALPPNWLEMPIAYNGRASSVVVSGETVRRPVGQLKDGASARPVVGPSRKLDFELEVAFIVGTGSAIGNPIPVNAAREHIFGMVLLNDWSARDIQQWEYVPLGPFNGKSFATSISPWVVTLDALEPFRTDGPLQQPKPLAYLQHAEPATFDIELEVTVTPSGSNDATIVSRSNTKFLYWSIDQQLAHHTMGGCNMRSGDLMGSGTISGPVAGSAGSLLELTHNGEMPLTLRGGRALTFLEDGDRVTMSARCERPGLRIGFGCVTGVVGSPA